MGLRLMAASNRGASNVSNYSEGYNAGYEAARNNQSRTRSIETANYENDMRQVSNWGDPYKEMEMRRRRRSEANNHWGDPDEEMEMRRRRRSQMGFDIEPDDMRSMMHDMKSKLDKMSSSMGKASSVPLDPSMESVLEDATKVLKNPPSTWQQYLQNHDVAGIARMEGRELMKALESGKPVSAIRKELTHTIAALMKMVNM